MYGCDEGDTTAWLDYLKRALRYFTADGLEHRVAVRHELGEVLHVIVDDLVGPEPAHVVMVWSAGGGEHPGTDVPGQLDRDAGDSARASLNQDCLA